MARDKQHKSKHRTPPSRRNPGWLLLVGIILLGGAAAAFIFKGKTTSTDSSKATNAVGTLGAAATNVVATSTATNAPAVALPSIEINQAVMVTQELDFGTPVPTIAEALQSIERRYQPEDGVGRTFAILDAYGEPTPEGKLHISMHVSTEKPGIGSIIFRRTGQVLWSSRITALTNAAKPAFNGKSLTDFGNVQLRITTAAGVRGLYTSNGAHEMILPPGTRYLVKSVTKLKGKALFKGLDNSNYHVEVVALPPIDADK